MNKTFFYTTFIFWVLHTAAIAEYNDSNYLTYPDDSVNQPPESLSGWGASHPSIGTVVDAPSAYGGGVKRRADHNDLIGDYGGGSRSHSLVVYSRFTPVNSDGTLVLIHGDNSTSCWVYHTETNTSALLDSGNAIPLRINPSMGQSSRALGEKNELRWDYTGLHPNRLYFIGYNIADGQGLSGEDVSMSFYYVDIDTTNNTQAVPVLIHDFSNEFPSSGTYPTGGFSGGLLFNDVEGDSSNDSRYWAWMIVDATSTWNPWAFITYDRQTDTIIGRALRDCTGVSGPCTEVETPAAATNFISRPNMIEISPSGNYVHINWGRAYSGYRDADIEYVSDGPKACNKDFTDCFRIGADQAHSGWAWGSNGEEMFVLQNNRDDTIEAVDISGGEATAKCSLITGNNYTCGTDIALYTDFDPGYANVIGFHFGKIYDQNKRGYALVNTYESVHTHWGHNIMGLIKIWDRTVNGTKLWRIASTYNTHFDYRSEGSGALNFTGDEIWTSANWGTDNTATGSEEVYSIGMPSNWYCMLEDNCPQSNPPNNSNDSSSESCFINAVKNRMPK